MQIAKIAGALGALVVVGLIIYALLNGIMPAAFEYVKCAFGSFLTPSNAGSTGGGGIGTCGDAFMNAIKLGGS